MSLVDKQTITCPNCGNSIEATVWDSLNTKINPEMKEELINGNMFKTICKYCKKAQNLVYPILYHDQPKKLMIYCAVTDDDFEYALSEINHYCKIEKDYIFRIVRSQEALREKAMIFDNGLDDRIVEHLKYIYTILAKKQIPNLKITQSFLIKQGDNFCVQPSIDNHEFLVFDINHYNTISKLMADSINDIKICDCLVDLNWAKNNAKAFIKIMEQNENPKKEEKTTEKNTIVCNNCGQELFGDSEFCHKCGEKVNKKIIKFCRKCGKELVPNSNFCSDCGTKTHYP